MNAGQLVDREELRKELLGHIEREGAELAGKLAGVLVELLERKDPISFEKSFHAAIDAFGSCLMGEGLRGIEPEAKGELKKGAIV